MEGGAMGRRWALVSLATAQFVMVLDQSVMNVSISQLVEDFDTTVTVIQAVITLYCLVMAMFMLTGGKIGDIVGRRPAQAFDELPRFLATKQRQLAGKRDDLS